MALYRTGSPIKLFGLFLAGLILALGIGMPPPAGVEHDVQLVLAIFFATVALWITEPVPYTVSSLFSVILLFGLGAAETFSDAVGGFASTLVFFFILLLLIGKSVAKVNLDDWVAKRLVTATSTPKSSIRRVAATILLLAFIMPSGMARTASFMPVIDQINDLYEREQDSNFRRLGYYLVGHVNPLSSMALMTGGGMSIVTAELINDRVQPITWVEWAVYMVPAIVMLFVTCAIIASLFYRVKDTGTIVDDINTGSNSASSNESAIDQLTRDQKIVVTTMVTAIIFWIVGSFIGIPTIIPAMYMVFVLALPGVNIITADEFRSLSWGIIFLIGAMLSILDVMQETNALDFIIDALLSGVLVTDNRLFIVMLLLVFVIIVRGAFSGVSAAIVILLPILLEFTGIIGLNPLYTSLGLLIILGTVTFHPFNQPTILLAYNAGPLSLREVVILGATTLMSGLLVVIVSWLFYWPIVDGIVASI